MATSLSRQLQRLKAPQTQVLTASKKGVSILFDSREAENTSFDTAYDLGLEGLKELSKLEPRLQEFENLLFSEAAKSLQRSVQTAEVNKKLDGHIRRFLLLLSPHLLLKPALSALEWLVQRFQVGEYNGEDLLMTALPYHSTRTFVLILRAVPLIKNPQSPWHWLRAVADTGTPLDALSVHKALANSTALLRLLCDFTLTAHKTYPRGEASRLQTQFSFCCASLLGVMETTAGGVTQAQLACMLPLLRHGLAATTSCLAAGCLAVVAHLATRAALSQRAAQDIIMQLIAVKVQSLHLEAASVLLLIFTAQPRLGAPLHCLPTQALAKVSWLPPYLGKLCNDHQGKKVEVVPLLLPLMTTAMEEINLLPSSRGRAAAQLVSRCLDEVSLSVDAASQVVKLVFSRLPEQDGSDEEKSWFQETCQTLERKFPESYDSETRTLLAQGGISKSKLKGLLQTVSLGGGELTTPRGLLHTLSHPEEAVRAAAVICLGKAFNKLPEEERGWMIAAVQERLTDDSMQVIQAVLQLPNLPLMLGGMETLTETLINLLDVTPHKKWSNKALQTALKTLCNTVEAKAGEMQQLCVLLAILPHLIMRPALVPQVASSSFGSNNRVIQAINKSLVAKEDVPAELLVFTAVTQALKQAPPEALALVSWRLKSEDLSSLELLLLCKLLSGAAKQLDSAEEALQCCHLALTIRDRSRKVLAVASESSSKVQQVQKIYNDVVKGGALPISALSEVLVELARRPLSKIHGKVLSRASSSIVTSRKTKNVLCWSDLTTAASGDMNETNVQLCAMLLPVLLQLCSQHPVSDGKNLKLIALRDFLQANFPSVEQQLHMLNVLCVRPGMPDEDIVRCLKFSASLIRSEQGHKSDILQLQHEGTLVPSLLCSLSHSQRPVRDAAMKVLKELAMLEDPNPSVPSYHCLILSLLCRGEELLQDEGQLSVVLFSLLSPDPSVQSLFLRSHKSAMSVVGRCLMNHVCSTLTPRHVAACLLQTLRHVRSQEFLVCLAPLGRRILSEQRTDNQLDESSWLVLTNVLQRIDEGTCDILLKDEGWQLLQDALSSDLEYKEQTVATTTLATVSKEVFTGLGSARGRLLSLVLSLGPHLSSQVGALLRRVVLDGPLVAEQLRLMAPVPQLQSRRRRSEAPTKEASEALSASAAWSRGVVLLEALQEKKKLVNTTEMVPVLFHVLKTCMEGEGEGEYAKQLVLGCLSNSLAHLEAGARCQMDVELVVQCLRGTNNPHTQHHALLLLCHTAHTLPDGLMHHLVSMFTFMGSLVMRHDDAYSFHVISEVIDKVVPVILKSQNGSSGAVSVLRVFVDAMPDVPSHRREPIFSRLLLVLGWERLWLFLALALEPKKGEDSAHRGEKPRLACALELASSCELPHLLAAFNRLIIYLGVLATVKYGESKQVVDATLVKSRLRECGAGDLMDPCSQSGSETRRLQISGLAFISDLLATRAQQSEAEQLSPELESLYQQLMETLMSYLNILTKEEQISRGQPTAKFWPAMLHHAYAVLNKVNMLLPTRQFLAVVRGVLAGPSGSVRTKTLELLGARLQLRGSATLGEAEKTELLALVPTLKSLALSGEGSADKALFCLRIMAKQLAANNAHTFVPVLISLIQLAEEGVAPAMLANALLCLAELCASLRAQAVPCLPRLVPVVLSASAKHRQPDQESSELVVVAAAAGMQRLVETLPLFLSPFLPAMLRELCLLSATGHAHLTSKVAAALHPKLAAIKEGIGSKVALRILLPAVCGVFDELSVDAASLPALGPLLSVLASSFSSLERADIDAHISELTNFFQHALELRSDWDQRKEDMSEEEGELVTKAEAQIISALVTLIMKLPENVFRPLYFKLSAWSSQAEQQQELRGRCITFYRCSTSLAAQLKGLFVVFAFYFLKQAAGLLRRCHSSSTEEKMFTGEKAEARCCLLLDSVLDTLLNVFSHDKQNFVNKECFDVLMQPLVDQLENEVGGQTRLKERCKMLVAPCLAQFARATADDVLWKQLNYQVLLKTRHSTPAVRVVAVGAVQRLAEALGEELLPLLPEAVPFLAELLEDEDDEVEVAAQDAVREMERILGEPLQKYF